MSKVKSTLSTPFILLRQQNSKKSVEKKLLLPKTLTLLVRTAKKMFNGIIDVKTILDKDGRIIRVIEDVIPGETYYVSNIDKDYIPEPPIGGSSKIYEDDITVYRRLDTGKGQNSVFGNPEKSSASGVGNAANRSTPGRIGAPITAARMFFGQSNDIKIHNQSDEDTETDPDDIESDTEKDNEKSSELENRSKQSPKSPGTPGSGKGNDTICELNEDGTTGNEQKQPEIPKCFNTLIENDQLTQTMNEALNKMPGYKKEFIAKSEQLEIEQVEYWMKNYYSLIPIDDNNIFMPKETNDYINSKLITQVRVTNGGSVILPRIIVEGPRESGKSTLLAITSRNLISLTAALGHYKDTAFAFFDGKEFATLQNDPAAQLKYCVDVAINSLKAARPNTIAHATGLRRAFLSILDSDQYHRVPLTFSQSPEFTKTAPIVNKLIAGLVDAKYGRVPPVAWISNLIYLPSLLTSAFGVKKFVFVVDNFEYFDYSINSADEQTSIIEIIKYALTLGGFVIAGEDENNFYNAVGPNSPGIDLFSKALCMSTIGVLPLDNQTKISIQLSDSPQPMHLTGADFGGAPPFAAKWARINELLDAANPQTEEEDENSAEAAVELCTVVGAVLQDLYSLEERPSVISVKRT